MDVEDLLQKHHRLETDIDVVGYRVRTVNNGAKRFVDGEFPEAGGEDIYIFLYNIRRHIYYYVTVGGIFAYISDIVVILSSCQKISKQLWIKT